MKPLSDHLREAYDGHPHAKIEWPHRILHEAANALIQSSNTMTHIQYKAAIKALGLSQERAGDWLGIGRRTSQGYALGEYPVPEPVAKLLRLCVKMNLKPEDVK